MIVLDTFETYKLVHVHRAYLIINDEGTGTLVLATHDPNMALDTWARLTNNKENKMNNDQAAEGCGLVMVSVLAIGFFILLQPLISGLLFIFGG